MVTRRTSFLSRLCNLKSTRLFSDEKGLQKSEGDGKGKTPCELTMKGKKKDPLKCVMDMSMKKKVKVTLLSSDNLMGSAAALSLKAKGKHIKELRLWDPKSSLRGMALDLSHIPTSVRVQGYVGEGQLEQSLRDVDLVIVMGGSWGAGQDLFYKNSEMVREMARAIVLSSPKALVGLAVNPITSILSFFAETERLMGGFCPERLVGLLCLEEMRTRSLLAEWLTLPPGVVEIKLTGGSTPGSLVPVLESGPGGEYLGEGAIVLTKNIRDHTNCLMSTTAIGRGPELAAGYAVAKFVNAVAEGMCTGNRPTMSLMVKTTALPGVPYLVLPVNIGPTGVETISNIPKLSEREFRLLISGLSVLKEDISTGETWAHTKRHSISVHCN